jgi:arylsulfatase A-like enzyme
MVKPQVSEAMVSQMDLLASFSKLINQPIPNGDAPDSENLLDAFLGKSPKGRSVFVEHAGTLAVIKDGWKYISPSKGAAYDELVAIETGNSPEPQLYNLNEDKSEKHNLAAQHPDLVNELKDLLMKIKQKE